MTDAIRTEPPWKQEPVRDQAPYVRCDACVRLLRNDKDTQSLIVVGTNVTARAIGQLVL